MNQLLLSADGGLPAGSPGGPRPWGGRAASLFGLLVLGGMFVYFFQAQWGAPALLAHEVYVPTRWMHVLKIPFIFNGYHGSFESLLATPFLWSFGVNQFALRAIPFFYSLSAVGIFYWLCARVYRSPLWGFAAAWLLVTSPVFIIASGTGVFHATPMFTIILASLAFLSGWHASGDVRCLIAAACFSALALGMRIWSHLFLISIAAGLVALGGIRSLSRDRVKPLVISALAVAAVSPAWAILYRWSKGDLASYKTASAVSLWLENGESLRTLLSERFLRHYQSLRQHLDGTHYVQYVLEPIRKAAVAEAVFWTCFGLGVAVMLLRRDRLAGARAGLAPYVALPLYFLLTLSGKMVFESMISNQLFPVCFLLPFIVLGPFWTAGRTALVPRRAAAWAAAAAVLAISADHGRLLMEFRQKLSETGGLTRCSVAIPELAAFAERSSAGRLVLGNWNWDASELELSVRCYSGERIKVDILGNLPEGQRIEGAFVSLYTRQRAAPADLLWKLPGGRERIFYGKDGRPQFVFHSLSGGTRAKGLSAEKTEGALGLSAWAGGKRFPAEKGSKASGYLVLDRGGSGGILYVQEDGRSPDAPSPHSIWAASGARMERIGNVSVDRNGVGAKFLGRSALEAVRRADALFVCPPSVEPDQVPRASVLRIGLRAAGPAAGA